jgi:hypothetical protein
LTIEVVVGGEVAFFWEGKRDVLSRFETVSFKIELNRFSLPVPVAADVPGCCAGGEKGRRGAIFAMFWSLELYC